MRTLATTACIAASLLSTPALAQTPSPDSFACSITINYAPGSGAGEIYQHDFTIVAGGTYRDDTSSATREHTLSVSSVVRPGRVFINADYFSDVGALTTTSTAMTLRMRRVGRAVEIASGRHQHWHSVNGTYNVTYVFRCQKQEPAATN